MSKTFDQLRKNGGQATVEYILLLVVIIALILGPLKQFSEFFNGYVDALFGEGQYFACMLETGELDGQSNDSSSCMKNLNAKIQTALSGSGAGSSSGGASGSTSTNKDGSQDSSSPSSSSSKASTNQAAVEGSGGGSDSGGSGSGENFGGGPGGSSVGAGRSRTPSRQVVKSNVGEKDSAGDESYQQVGEQFDYKSLRPKGGFEVKSNRFNRGFSEEDDVKNRVEKLAPKEVASTNSNNLRAKELSIDPQRAPSSKQTDIDGDGFGFGYMLKWLLILGVLVAIFVVIGGQVVQISKGGDN